MIAADQVQTPVPDIFCPDLVYYQAEKAADIPPPCDTQDHAIPMHCAVCGGGSCAVKRRNLSCVEEESLGGEAESVV